MSKHNIKLPRPSGRKTTVRLIYALGLPDPNQIEKQPHTKIAIEICKTVDNGYESRQHLTAEISDGIDKADRTCVSSPGE